MPLPTNNTFYEQNARAMDSINKNMVGYNQRARNQALRSIPNTDPSSLSKDLQNFRGTDDTHRFAGYKEQQDPVNVDEDTKNFLGDMFASTKAYGKETQGYYGNNNPYTQEGALAIAHSGGFDPASSELKSKFQSMGLKLPSVYGTSLDNEQIRNLKFNQQQQYQQIPKLSNEEMIAKLNSTLAPNLVQQSPKGSRINEFVELGFKPGEDFQNWKWTPVPERPVKSTPQALNNNNTLAGIIGTQPSDVETPQSNGGLPNNLLGMTNEDFYDSMYAFQPKGSGSWQQYDENGVPYGYSLGYSPLTGFTAEEKEKGLKFSPEKWMPQLTKAVLGAITGGAAGVAFGAGAGAASTAAAEAGGSALANTAVNGFSTGDWNSALKSGLTSGLGSGLGSLYGGDVNNLFGLSNKSGFGSGIIKSGIGLGGNALSGKPLDWQSALANLVTTTGGNYLGGLAKETVGGGLLGNVAQGATKGLLSSIGPKGIDLSNAAVRTALGAASPALSNIFNNNNNTTQQQNTRLVDSGLNLAHKLYKQQKNKGVV